MTDSQFEIHWLRLVNKYPTHFKNEDHKSREWTDWYDNFIKLEDDITKQAFDYYFRHLARSWFPDLPDMLNAYNLMYKEKTSKKMGENHKKQTIRHGITRNFYDTIQSLKKRIKEGEVQVGFTDNRFEGGGAFTNYKSVSALSECFVKMFKDIYETPALAEHRRKKLAEPKKNRSVEEMLDGFVDLGEYHSDMEEKCTKWTPKRVKQKLCYYCEKRVTKDNGVFRCEGCQVEYS